MNGCVYVLVGPTEYEEMGVCGVFWDPVEADRAARRAPEFFEVDGVPEQYRVVEVESGVLIEGGFKVWED